MNLVTLLDRTLRLGYWGGSTLFHMAICMLAGFLLLLFPEEISRLLLEEGIVGAIVSSSSSSTSSEVGTCVVLMTPVVAFTVARLVGFHLSLVGLLFGLFGSVSDRKARMRLNYFALLWYTGGIVFLSLQLYLRTGLLRRDVLVSGLLIDALGLSLGFVCLYYLTHGNTPDPVAELHASSSGKKKHK